MCVKCVCRAPLSGSDEAAMEEDNMVIDEEKADLEAQMAQAVEDLNLLCQANMCLLIICYCCCCC
jgi:hypothetical protein